MSEKTSLLKSLKAFTVALMASTPETPETPVELAAMKLEDKVTVIEAEVFEAGQPVFVVSAEEGGEKITEKLPVNEEGYVLEDGQILVVKEEGVIFSIGEKPAEEEEAPAEAPAEEVAASESNVSPVAKKIVEAVTRESHFSKEDVTLITKNVETMLSSMEEEEVENGKDAEILALKAEVLELKKAEDEPATKEIKHNPEKTNEVNLSSINSGSLMEYLNSLK
jgi:hypothetical protein